MSEWTCQKCGRNCRENADLCLSCAMSKSEPASVPGSVKIELRYNGDYPGYACIRINDRWATDKEKAALVTIFGARGIKHLYDIAGAERSHEEHKPWVGTLSFLQNEGEQEGEAELSRREAAQ